MTAETPDETFSRLGHELAQALHQVALLMEPIWDAADGVKSTLERRGWSPTVSEELSAEYLKLCMRRLFEDLSAA
ncbi:hypothetical protein [Streptomyces sp. NPDC056291]|uniref:hypothetical protein n=1 Tax=Streptomyces sp. NPDC056291 TaxID=3345772 RepID=UPI0035DBF42C